ncbi:type IV pilus modification PilV family protein [Microbacterium rhizosphaerae]|uniref:Type II secretion system protein n=1 Tax=Microbacterium rhizosphaerae TaxID=1678237 RepID=A0ABZ0SV76_9MICO|nr:type II secretion system protein [Microbacterium rhizosphaerae]WPR91147.1 type II secretion system protein [Microbacterium rhizosphaerae]
MRKPDDEGFGLVEVIIAFFLLAIIAVAILPALVNGIRFSAAQSTVATATRHLNGLVEEARTTPTCATLVSVATPATFTDGRGKTITSSGTVGTCASGSAVSLDLKAAQGGVTLASVNALVYVP